MEAFSIGLISLATILSGVDTNNEQVALAQVVKHDYPIIAGQWELALDKQATDCREIYNFDKDDLVVTTSADEWTYGNYFIKDNENGLPMIAIKTVYDNNKKDCSGIQVDQAGESLLVFLNYQQNQMYWCADPNGKLCSTKFTRVLP